MASRRVKLISAAAILVLGAGGWLVHTLMAAQAQGALAQAPLNTQVQVPPAFVMAVDDSGSMTFETLFPPQDGTAFWDPATAATNGYFLANGNFRTTGAANNNHHLIPHAGSRYRIGTNRYAIPPIDNFGFARSHEYNPQYFNPAVTYLPWVDASGNPIPNANTDAQGNADPTATRVDPRDAAPTIDFTAQREEGATAQLRFRALQGTVLPVGTRYQSPANCGGLTNTGANWVELTNPHLMTGNCEIGISYFPAVFYLKETTPAPAGFEASARIGPIPNAGGPGVSMYKYEIKPANYTSPAAYQAAIRNFANWFSYYGNRNRSMIASMTQSLSGINNMRVGYFTINQHGNRANPVTNAAHRVAMHDMATPAGRTALYTQLLSLPAAGSTPNRQAVQAMGQQFLRTDAGAPVQLACQKNAGMLFTDGYSNSDGPTGIGNIDGPLGFPFADAHSNTLADIATQYYVTNLRPTLPAGRVPVPSGCSAPNPPPWLNCNANPHMNFYGITLGATGQFWGVTHNDFMEGYTNPPAWPPRTNDQPNAVDDIWHAAVNTRGEFINAYTPNDVTNAMRRILAAVGAGSSPSGTLALTGTRISARSLNVQPLYEVRNEGTDWFSKLTASRIVLDPVTRTVSESQLWEASDRLGAMSAATRSTQTWFGTASGASQFNGGNVTLDMLCNNPRPGMSRCSAAELSALGVNAAEATAYLLGDASKEVDEPAGTLRSRTTVLGDIVNSSPVVSSPTDDYGYRGLPAPYGSSYNTYMNTKQGVPIMVYVGANDGMLHAFHGGMNYAGVPIPAEGGRQQFAFIPRTVLGHMGNLLFPYNAADGGDQKFDHRYFVDGPIAVSDAYYGGGWKTVLVGSTGAGGRGVFGLNITNPTSFSATSKLWEIDDQHPTAGVRNNIGHVLGKPVIVPVKNGAAVEWKAIFGNGYNSNNGRAVLYIVDIATGSVRMIEAIESNAPPVGTNGLGNVIVMDRWGGPTQAVRARDGFADTVYAADQKGALWRFDLRSGVNTIDTPVFVTAEHMEGGQRYRQPILGGLTATAARGGNVMIMFGTGSFSFVNDASDASIQGLYGVLDAGLGSTLTPASLSTLQIATTVDGVRTIQTNTTGSYGWTLRLPAGERMVGNPRVASGVVFFPTYAPSVADGCSTSGFNWLYGLNARSGNPALSSVRFGTPTGATQGAGVGAVALDTGGTAPVKDIGLTVLSSRNPEVPACDPATDPTCVPSGPSGDEGCFIRISVPGMAQAMFVPYPCGRQSWRQLL
jgi:type IV pilus assembly protein PilY1